MIASIRFLAPGLLAGLGAWCTAARLDVVPGTDGPIRVALFAPIWWLIFSTVAGAGLVLLAGEALPWLARRVGDRHVSREAARAALWPFAAASLIALPYLPWLPDKLPVLTVLAGPGRWLVWGIAVAETAWAVIGAAWSNRAQVLVEADGRPAAPGFSRTARVRFPVAILILGLIATGAAAAKLTGTVLFPGGDEPHYLIIAQSLWRDGDLQIENNHQRRDYAEYFRGRELQPHTLARGKDEEVYSVHPVGLPVLLAPVYAFAGYGGAASVVVLMACTAGAVMTSWVARLTGSVGAAAFSWAALLLGAPLFYNAFAIYPEVPAALAVTLAFTLSAPTRQRTANPSEPVMSSRRALACGLAIAALPWLSTKYALMAGALGLVVLGRLWLPFGRLSTASAPPLQQPAPGTQQPRWRRCVVPTIAVALPCFVSLIGWLLFFKLIWDSWSPMAAYGTQRETSLAYLPYGGPGLLFDQEYGVVAFAPILFLGLTGLVSMVRRPGHLRRLGIEIALVFAALLGVVGAFHLWWGGTAIVGRPIVSALWLFALPIAWQHRRAAGQPVRRAVYRLVLWIGLAITVTVGVAQQGLLLNANRDGTSQLLDYLSPAWPLTAMLPTYIASGVGQALTTTVCWVAVALGAGWLLKRADRLPALAARPRLAAIVALGGAVLLLSSLVPLVTSRPVSSVASMSSRTQVSLLDGFDSTVRPWAIRYDPMQAIDPSEVPSLFTLTAHPAPQLMQERGLLGGRLTLPAGRYRVELQSTETRGSVAEGEFGLQLGQLGGPVQRWPVRLGPGEAWQAEFELPIDVNYVGFVGSRALEQHSAEIRVTPLAVVNVRDRQSRLDVASARTYGSAQVIAHDHRAWLEPAGLWVQGRASVPLTLWRPGNRRAKLIVHARLVPVTVTAVTATTRDRYTLGLGESADLWIPLDARGVGHVLVTSSNGSLPSTIIEGSPDRRYLGCWIEIGDSARQMRG
ncbi:MAG: hypothetical protein GEV06_05170 [Luteitalea sp.]|nr:hypothetical protein [Luteitalea sp.]